MRVRVSPIVKDIMKDEKSSVDLGSYLASDDKNGNSVKIGNKKYTFKRVHKQPE